MKKAWTIIGRVVTTLILIFAVCVMIFTVISVNTVGKDADFAIFDGYPFSNLTRCVMTIIDGEIFKP